MTAIETEEVHVQPLSPEKIARDRAAAKVTAATIPDEPMDSPESDVIGHPSAGFNDMASKLEKALSEVGKKGATGPTDDTAPKEMKQASSKKPGEGDKESQTNQTSPTSQAEDPLDKTITSAKAADWKALKEKTKTFETQAKEWEQKHKVVATEYEEFRKKAGDVAVIESTKKERDEVKVERDKLQSQLETVALERSERFSSFYQQKFDEALKIARDAAGSEAERVEQLMALPPTKWRKEQLNAIREELIGYDQGQLDNAITQYDSARTDRDAKLKDSKTNYQKLVELETEKAAQDKLSLEKRREAITASVLTLARDFDSFKAGDDAAANAAVAQNEEFVKKFVTGKLDGTDLAMMPILATEAKRYKDVVVPALTKQVEELKAALAQYQGANPAPGGGGRVDAKGQPKGFVDTFNELWPAGNR